MTLVNQPTSNSISLVEQSVEIVTSREELEAGMRRIEKCGRICYQSEAKQRESTVPFIKRLIGAHHESVLEHAHLTVVLITDRATSLQLVRHRLASFSQESQRYVCYARDKATDKLQIVPPQSFYDPTTPYVMHQKFMSALERAYDAYKSSIAAGFKPEDARALLPNSCKTQIAITANIREWRTILRERCARAAQPQIRALMIALVKGLQEWSYLFEDIEMSDYGINRMPDIPTVPTMKQTAPNI